MSTGIEALQAIARVIDKNRAEVAAIPTPDLASRCWLDGYRQAMDDIVGSLDMAILEATAVEA